MSSVPPNWARLVDPATKRFYWFDKLSGVSQWESPAKQSAGGGWREYQDQATGRVRLGAAGRCVARGCG
jgi:hypothetical protein